MVNFNSENFGVKPIEELLKRSDATFAEYIETFSQMPIFSSVLNKVPVIPLTVSSDSNNALMDKVIDVWKNSIQSILPLFDIQVPTSDYIIPDELTYLEIMSDYIDNYLQITEMTVTPLSLLHVSISFPFLSK